MAVDATFRELFLGREDVWGAVHGECKKEPITGPMWMEHLHGKGSLGVYPLVPQDNGSLKLRWGCTDIDRGMELIAMARNLWKALKALGITSWVERTKGKGYHVWVFVTEWMEPESMRHALLVAHQVAGVPPTEVNPKQTTMEHLKGGFGNYVNLPHAKSFSDQGRRVILDIEHTQAPAMRIDDFVNQAWATRNTPAVVRKAASLYKPPPPERRVDIAVCSDEELAGIVSRLGGLAYTIFQKGPLEGRDRSSTLGRLVHLCREDGLQPSEAYAVLVDADKRWGKYSDRPDGEQQMQRIVTLAYNKA